MANVLTEEIEPGIRLVTLNRPEARNALSPGLLSELMEAMRECHRDRATRVVVLHGAGRGFCAAPTS